MKILVFFSSLFLLYCCNPSSPITTYSEQGRLITQIDLNLLEDTIPLSLSDISDHLRIIPLETTDSSLIDVANYLIGKQHILVFGSTSVLLFNKEGKFLKKLAVKGRGPNEFNMIVAQTFNSEENIVYALDYTNRLLSWHIPTGEFQEIPLSSTGYPHSIKLINDSLVIIGNLRGNRTPYAIYSQSINGKFLSGIPNLNNEDAHIITLSNNLFGDNSNIYYMPHRTDSIYLFQQDSLYLTYGILLKKNQEFHIQKLCRDYMFCQVFSITNTTTQHANIEGNEITSTSFDGINNFYQVNFKTKDIKLFRYIQNDYLGNMLNPADMILQTNDLFYVTYSAIELLQEIPKILKKSDLKPEIRHRLEQLLPQISEDNNPYLLIGESKLIR